MKRPSRQLVALACIAGCASLPRPQILDHSRATSRSPTQQEARQLAPQAHANAERLRLQAEAAYDSGKLELARALGERSLAAFERTTTQAHLARAEQRVAAARHDLSEIEQQLASLHAHQQQLDAEVRALELRIKVEREAEPRVPIKPASPRREAARRAAARSVGEHARLLCVAARLLADDDEPILDLLQSLDTLQAQLSKQPPSESISTALDLRAACLKALTRVRRTGAPADAPAASSLLSKLSAAMPDAAAFEDDRGVVVVQHAFLDPSRKALSETGRQRLRQLADVARAHPELPVLVVIHSDDSEAARRQVLESTKSALVQAGLERAALHHAGNRLPSAGRLVSGAKHDGERLEFVFVTR